MKHVVAAAVAVFAAAPALAHPGHTHGAEGAMHHVAWFVIPAVALVAAVAMIARRRNG